MVAALTLCASLGYGALAADPSWTPEPTDTPGPSWPALTEDGPWSTPALLSQSPDLALEIHALPYAWVDRSGPFVASDGAELTWSRVSSRDAEGQPFLGEIRPACSRRISMRDVRSSTCATNGRPFSVKRSS